jgi:hypothetical protein
MISCLYEHIEKQRVEQLIKHNDIDNDVKKQLKNYLKKYDHTHQGFKVEYETQGLMIGRKYAKGSLSLQNFKKSIRETLVYDTHTDVDIVNCHVVLLSQYCKKNGLVCDAVNDYVENRNVRLQEIIDTYKTTRKVAKDLFLIMMYGGMVNEYCCENGFDISVPMPTWVDNLEKEMKLLTERVCNIETSIFNDVKKLRKKEYTNKKTSCLSYVLQVIEDDIISKASSKLKQLGYCVDTLCFDGLLVHDGKIDNDVLEELSSYCYETTGYKVEFSFKPMEKHYDYVEDSYDFTNYEFEELDEYNQKYCDSLVGDVAEETYSKRKAYIEKFLCKVQQPEPLYVFQNGIHKTPQILNPSQLSLLLKPIGSGFMNQMNMSIPFYDKWSNDVDHRLYRTMDFLPFNRNNPIVDENVFNLFEGFNEDIYGEPMEQPVVLKKITPYLDLVQELCGGDDEHAMYFHKFIGQIFQDPSHKVPTCIILKGKQGVGKNIILDAIGNMLNKKHYITSSKPTDFFGEHAEGYYRKLLVNLNEAEGRDTFDFEGKIKSFISEDTITINPKNVRPTQISNHARTIITTNKPNPIPIDVRSKDRRYVVFQATDVYLKKSSKFWSQLYQHLRKPDTMKALYQWFMSLNLNDFDWIKRRPITKAYKDMCNLYSPVEALFFEEFVDKEMWNDFGIEKDKHSEMIITMADLFNMYEQFCKRNRFLKDDTKATSSRAFVGRLTELELPIVKYKTMGNNSFKFIPQEVYNYLDKRRWINGYKDDEDEMVYVDEGENAIDGYFD